jgi:hypothetical protein
MARMMADCRRFESDSNCSMTMMGERDEVAEAAAMHAVAVHGHEDTPEFRAQIVAMLEPASAYSETREPEPFPV